jgi:aspartyl protease family protein
MVPRNVIGLFIAAVAVGWMMPAPQKGAESATEQLPAEQMQSQHERGSGEVSDEFLDPDQVILQRQADGHFYADADVDGAQLRFLVDTGASGIALTAADAEAMGISWDTEGLQKVGRGVSGDVFGKPVMIKSLRVGHFVAHDVPAAVIPEGLDVSLLGQSFLSTVGKLNIEQNRMTLN